MALHGKIVSLGHDKYGFENIENNYNEPKQTRRVWPLINCKTSGMSWIDINDVYTKQAECHDGVVRVYMGNGNYFTGMMPEGGSTKATIVETTDLPCPKVRKGIETQYDRGRWQKYLKTEGWVAA